MTDGGGEFLEVEGAVGEMCVREVDGAEVADGGLGRGRDLGDLGAEIREMNDVAGQAGLVALEVAGVLEDHPAVAGLGECAHHAGVEIAGLDLARVELPLASAST